MSDEKDDAGVVQEDMTPREAVEWAAEGEINIIEALEGEEVAVLPASSPWLNGLRTALKEQQEADDER